MSTSRNEALTLGVEDGSFPVSQERRQGFKTLLVAALLSELQLRNIRVGAITVDGTDATEAILGIIKSLKRKPSVVMLAGISYGGFNFIDPFRLQEEADLPSIIVTTEKPNNNEVKTALQRHFPDWKHRWSVYRRIKSFQEVRANPR